ncbi:MAG: heavy-metal-associated domain-containing protein [Gemmatimonadaceae bacterium]|nr:heavy-metal-associated domain-containing protein [Chitinophagaceae bacterium]
MKKIILFFALTVITAAGYAQFSRATLQASGLTCAMCTKAIDNALKELSFVESVKPDIKNSAFNIVFKKDVETDPDKLKKAVEDAGFFIAGLKLTADFKNVAVANDSHINIGNGVYHFVSVGDQVLNGEKSITIVDKYFLTSKAFKKYSTATKMSCIQTGKAAECCSKDGIDSQARIYHVTI